MNDGTAAHTARGMQATRRQFLKYGVLGAGVTAAGLTLPLGRSVSAADWISTSAKPGRFRWPLTVPTPLTGTWVTEAHNGGQVEYLAFDITERATTAQILDPGAPRTPVLGYAAGSGAATVPGPLIKVPQGTPVKMRVTHAMGATHPTFGHALTSSVHLHGSASLPQYDGYADDVSHSGQYKDYYYPNHQGPRTLWYHDHAVHNTAKNVYSGLVAQYHITNRWEQDNLPQGKYDVPLTITDAIFASDGKLAYMDRDHSGLWGDVIMVNGTPWPFHNVERRFYRFRILMATLSRSMKLKLVNTRTRATLPVYVVATDGGLMVPQRVTEWRHAGAERYEIMVDFSGCQIGDKVELQNTSPPNNRDFLHTNKVIQFRVTSQSTETRWNTVVTPPPEEIHEVMGKMADTSMRRRQIDLEHDDVSNEFMINGQTWEDIQLAGHNLFADESSDPPKAGDYEIWRIENKSGGWFHPLHIHLVDFKVLSRRGGAGRVQPWEKGPKDVVYVGEGEIVEVLVHYAMPPAEYLDGRSTGKAGATGDQGGRYMIHCHNLSHEDHDMMSQFVVRAADGTLDLSDLAPNHPFRAAPPLPPRV
jgi:FtsP/CotA-like multicopper oxidase with cupredoxin domain